MGRQFSALSTACLLAISSAGQTLNLPPCPPDALSGSEFIKRIERVPFEQREQEIFSQVASGNVPGFLRNFVTVSSTNVSNGKSNVVSLKVAPDYLAIGSDEDYCLMPMTPVTAQRIADKLGCTLPTRKMVNEIYAAAAVKLAPSPIPPGPQMITVPEFARHNTIVRTQRHTQLAEHPLGALVAGDKKDVVITPRLATSLDKVAIYGWHQTNGMAIQPLYLGHTAAWVDYSHGIRLVQQKMTVNGKVTTVAAVLAEPELAGLLSDEGPIAEARYRTNALPSVPAQMKGVLDSARTNRMPTLADFKPNGHFGELIASFSFDPEAKVQINIPPRNSFASNKPVLLIFYALPNGNTTEQTIGKKLQPADDWHFDIQHIGAQTRFLRELLPDRTIVVAYLEAQNPRSWPDWRRRNGDPKTLALLDSVRKIFAEYSVESVLTGHSGGGSLTFGYLNAIDKIPTNVTRIAFLDSNYGYTMTNHLSKLTGWLKESPQNKLCVLAYDDANALLDGKSFVSAAGGTWGRSHTMLADLKGQFDFTSRSNGELKIHNTSNGQIQFLLKENPDRKILHTVQVERNGFIHAMVSGTPDEGKGYEYFGERAYSKWVTETP